MLGVPINGARARIQSERPINSLPSQNTAADGHSDASRSMTGNIITVDGGRTVSGRWHGKLSACVSLSIVEDAVC